MDKMSVEVDELIDTVGHVHIGAQRRVRARLDAWKTYRAYKQIDHLREDDFAKLFGCVSYNELINTMAASLDLVRRVELVGGPNGFAILKMMEARNE